MLGNIRLLFVFSLLLTAIVSTQADERKSFSRQMNEIKRSGNYVYVESSAQNEADAKASCNALLNIEITKYLTSSGSQPQDGGRIGNNIADCKIEYLVQPRGDMVRVFGYVAKSSISSNEDGKPEQTAAPAEATEAELPAPASDTVTATTAASNDTPETSPAPQKTVDSLKSDGLDLAKWQLDMLETIVKQPDMLKAKRLLNRYKNQNRIKRLGDKTTPNPRPTDTFHIIFDTTNKPVALLAPSSTANRYDMVSGTTVSFDTYSGNPYYWFQISQ